MVLRTVLNLLACFLASYMLVLDLFVGFFVSRQFASQYCEERVEKIGMADAHPCRAGVWRHAENFTPLKFMQKGEGQTTVDTQKNGKMFNKAAETIPNSKASGCGRVQLAID